MKYLDDSGFIVNSKSGSPQNMAMQKIQSDPEFKAKLTLKDKFHLCNLPFKAAYTQKGEPIPNFELVDIYLAVENIRDKFNEPKIEKLY